MWLLMAPIAIEEGAVLRYLSWALLGLLYGLICSTASAEAIVFFNSSQLATTVNTGVTSDTISSNGYLFTYTLDKLFTGGVGLTEPIGRPIAVSWPSGVEAQAVTSGPNPSGARIVIQRVDGDVFDLAAFTAKILANTGGAGASFEIMPSLNGEDAFSDPLYFDATGYYGSTFSYTSSPNYLGSTALLKGYDRYTIGLYVDFALTALTLEGAPVVPEPATIALAALGTGALAAVGMRRRRLRRF